MPVRRNRPWRARRDPRQYRSTGTVREYAPTPAGASAGAPFTLAFLDPPYNKGLVEPALAGLVSGKWLAENALAVVETGSDETITPDGWETVETRNYGAARIWFLKRA
nr:RsmD family RNA methyltransferase [Hyphomonas sp. L-53-1-40]